MKKQIFSLLTIVSSIFAAETGENYKFKDANEAYEKICAHCHTLNIAPKSIYMKMEGESVINSRRDSIIYVVRHGLNAMPSFRQTEIDNETLKELARKLASGEITYKEK